MPKLNNTQKTIRNSAVSVIAQICTVLLQYINRRVFVCFLDIEYLGYHSLFGSVFSLLSIAELGISSIFGFQLYKEIVNDNKDEIGKLMYIYKWMYRIVALTVLLLGVICYFFLPFFVKDASVDWDYLHIVYWLQLASVVFGYFLNYKRTLFIASQQEYKCVQVDLTVSAVIQVVQLVTLYLWRNYIIYLCVQLSTSVISNIVISIKYNKSFPGLNKKYDVSMEYIKSRNMFADLRDVLIHRISYAIYGGVDNVVISAVCGVRMVALYGNYFVIQKGVMQILFYKLLDPVQATIGNIVYSDRSKEDLWAQFRMFDVFSFFFATYIGIGFYVFFQPFIQVWMGKEYLLSETFVALLSITLYFWAVWEIVYKYRCVFGDYKQDRWMMVLSAVLNVAVSIPGAKMWGISGVQLGTLIAFFPIAYGRIRFVIKNYFNQSIKRFVMRHLGLFVIVVLEAVICKYICDRFEVSVLGFAERTLVILSFPTLINCILFSQNRDYRRLLNYMHTILNRYVLRIKEK
ncbi:MAG: hypothetical protein IKP14_07035 [Clostridiales bacterium]|nr:hypothetical protein [Clostridiales bacterium]